MNGAKAHRIGVNFALVVSDDKLPVRSKTTSHGLYFAVAFNSKDEQGNEEQRPISGPKKGVSRQDPRPDPRQRMNDEKLTFAGTLTDRRDE